MHDQSLTIFSMVFVSVTVQYCSHKVHVVHVVHYNLHDNLNNSSSYQQGDIPLI